MDGHANLETSSDDWLTDRTKTLACSSCEHMPPVIPKDHGGVRSMLEKKETLFQKNDLTKHQDH